MRKVTGAILILASAVFTHTASTAPQYDRAGGVIGALVSAVLGVIFLALGFMFDEPRRPSAD